MWPMCRAFSAVNLKHVGAGALWLAPVRAVDRQPPLGPQHGLRDLRLHTAQARTRRRGQEVRTRRRGHAGEVSQGLRGLAASPCHVEVTGRKMQIQASTLRCLDAVTGLYWAGPRYLQLRRDGAFEDEGPAEGLGLGAVPRGLHELPVLLVRHLMTMMAQDIWRRAPSRRGSKVYSVWCDRMSGGEVGMKTPTSYLSIIKSDSVTSRRGPSPSVCTWVTRSDE